MKTTLGRAALCTALAAPLCFAVPNATAADVAAGKAKAAEVCASCHGADGNSASADFPRIGGQYGDYIAKSLRDYKSGQRKNAVMAAFAQPLSKQEIENLAAYYASQPAVVSFKY